MFLYSNFKRRQKNLFWSALVCEDVMYHLWCHVSDSSTTSLMTTMGSLGVPPNPLVPFSAKQPYMCCHKVMDQNQGSTNESIEAIALVLILHVGRVRWKQGSILNFTTYVGFAAGEGISFIPASNIYFISSSNIYSLPCLAVSDCQNSKPSCLIPSQLNLFFKWDWARMGKS